MPTGEKPTNSTPCVQPQATEQSDSRTHSRTTKQTVLLGLVAATTVTFAQVDATAGKLMAPYLAFTAFANALNWSVWSKNPGEVGAAYVRFGLPAGCGKGWGGFMWWVWRQVSDLDLMAVRASHHTT
jgi:hypothetical protein